MSLKSFHLFFIAVCFSLGLFMVYWGYEEHSLTQSAISRAMIIIGALDLILLVPYGFWFKKKMGLLPIVAIMIACSSWPASSYACAVCFGDPDSGQTKSVKVGILFLMAIIGAVLTAIFFKGLEWSRKDKKLES